MVREILIPTLIIASVLFLYVEFVDYLEIVLIAAVTGGCFVRLLIGTRQRRVWYGAFAGFLLSLAILIASLAEGEALLPMIIGVLTGAAAAEWNQVKVRTTKTGGI